jgi:serine/threonine-protein kinase
MDNQVSVIVTHDPQLLLLWPETETMTVQALSTDEAKMLAVSLLEHVQIKVDDIGSIIAASKGSPLMLIELVRLAAIDTSFRHPRSLPEVINQRISLLPPKTRTLLHTMSVLGRPTHAETLVTVLEDEPEAEHRALNFLAEQGFLLGTKAGWRPSHRMHRQVAYASIPAALKLQLHAKAADMAIDEGEPTALVAHHLFEAGEHEQAVPYLLRAGERALYFLDDQLAHRLFARVLQLVPQPPERFQGERGPWTEATLGLANAMHDGGDTTQALRLLKQSMAKVEAAGWEREQHRLERELKRLRKLAPRVS